MSCGLLVSSPVISQSSLVDETPRKRINDNSVPFGGSVLREIRGVQRKPLLAPLLPLVLTPLPSLTMKLLPKVLRALLPFSSAHLSQKVSPLCQQQCL